MDTQVSMIESTSLLVDGEILIGKIKKPFIQDGKLMGAVLSFDGKSETALLHRKQMVGSDKIGRLANMRLGDEVTVKLLVTGERPERKTWASEACIDDSVIIERLLSLRPKGVLGKVVNATDYGVFIELQDGPAAGRRGLVHAKNMGNGRAASLSAFTSYLPGAAVCVDVLGAQLDTKGTVRIDLALSKAA
jgi:ribosomal protein S1